MHVIIPGIHAGHPAEPSKRAVCGLGEFCCSHDQVRQKSVRNTNSDAIAGGKADVQLTWPDPPSGQPAGSGKELIIQGVQQIRIHRDIITAG